MGPVKQPVGQDVEYVKKRERNNVAVRRSREKSRQKQRETLHKVNRLREENEELEMKVKLLSKELSVLRDLFLEHAGVSSKLAGHSFSNTLVKEEPGTDEEEEEEPQVCPVNKLAAKMDHEYSFKSFSASNLS